MDECLASGLRRSWSGWVLGYGGTATLTLDGAQIGEGRMDATIPMIFSSEATDVGNDSGSAVSDDYSTFTGTVNWVHLDIGDDSHDHLMGSATLPVPIPLAPTDDLTRLSPSGDGCESGVVLCTPKSHS